MSSTAWFTTPPKWTGDHKTLLLSEDNKIEPIPEVKLKELIKKSSKFPVKFPINTILCNTLKRKSSKTTLETNINSAYPVLHEYALHLCATFLLYQKTSGNVDFYKDMTLADLIDRLLKNRAISFVGPMDRYMLLDGTTGAGGWDAIGTPREKSPLILRDYLSYDEIRLSALLSVSSHTYFINDGNRRNSGVPEEDLEKIEETGVIVGLIGTRLEKECVMEYREIVKSFKQNVESNGYGKSEEPTLQGKFLEFYGDTNGTYKELLEQFKSDPDRYSDMGGNRYFDRLMFERRVSLSFDTLLIEANARAKEKNTKAFVHVVGIGLGVWKRHTRQNKFFVDTFANRLELLQNLMTNVSDVCFAYIKENKIGPYSDGDKVGTITVHINDRNPHERLKGAHHGKLLVVSYAWDGNAHPGNEFWWGSLDSSGDPAAACSTQVAELHNYHVNDKIRGANLKIATLEHGLVTFQQYQELHQYD